MCKCELCKKEFKTERGLLNHKCQIKDRVTYIQENHLLPLWKIYKEVYYINFKQTDELETLDFATSPMYKKFVDFINWALSIRMLDFKEYIIYMSQTKTPLYKWVSEDLYRWFLVEYLRQESILKASSRSELYLKQCGYTLDTVASNRLYQMMLSGEVSNKYLRYKHVDINNVLDSGQLRLLGQLAVL